MTTDWRTYLDKYHSKHPAITQEILSESYDPSGDDPYDWLLSALPESSGSFVDLACGSAPMAARLSARGSYIGVDRSAAELHSAQEMNPEATFLEADVLDLPMPKGAADAVVCSMALMLLQPLDQALREVGRILSPGGTMVATFPVDGAASIGQLKFLIPTFWRLRSLPSWPQRITKRFLSRAIEATPLRLVGFERRTFDWEISDAVVARRFIEGLYLPDTDRVRKETTIDYVVSKAPKRPTVPVHIGRAILTRA